MEVMGSLFPARLAVRRCPARRSDEQKVSHAGEGPRINDVKTTLIRIANGDLTDHHVRSLQFRLSIRFRTANANSKTAVMNAKASENFVMPVNSMAERH
jgi:hypothetical protein